MIQTCFYISFFLVLFLSHSFAQHIQYPLTQKIDHDDAYFGVKVHDPYRWLEKNDSSAVADWVTAQNKVTFGYLSRIPYRAAIKERLLALWNYPRYTAPIKEGENYFFTKNDGLQNQSVVYIQHGLEGTQQMFLDPNTFSVDGTVSLGGSSISNDGKYFAYSISRSGSDWREIFVIDIATQTKLRDSIAWVKFSGMSWYKNGFFYNRYEAPHAEGSKLSASNINQKIYYHIIGTDQSEDRLIKEDPAHPQRRFSIGATDDERFQTLYVSESGKKGNALYYRDMTQNKKDFSPIIETMDDQLGMIDHVDGKFICSTNRNAPMGKVVLIDPANPEERAWKDVIPERDFALAGISAVGGKLIITYMQDAHHRVYQYDLNGNLEGEIILPTLCTVGGFSGKREDTFTFYTINSFTSPSAIYKYDIATRQSTLYRKTEIDFDASAYEAKQVFFTSKDGTRIPMFIVQKKGLVLNGKNPTLLYGYGGFNASMTPSFSASRLLWLESGGVYALVNLRGGGEYGEKWHEAGTKLNKQNVFDDCIAAAEYLINEKYTSPKLLALQGGSNGGLLVGAVINQRPDLFRVALPAVGVMDMLRFHKFTIGSAWIADYGSSDDSVQFHYLHRYSPLHNIRSGIEYPATLVTTADHDDRVVPAHSFKYISTLQEKYNGTNPVLIRIETKAGHGGGKPISKIVDELADTYAFMFFNMGIVPKY